MIGLLDSGLGGLTVLAALRAAHVSDDVIYFADQAHVPYGDRSDADLAALLEANVALLEAHGVDAIVMACNTSCAIGRKYGWPRANVPILDLIASAALPFMQAPAQHIAVIATAATVRSGAYGDALARAVPNAAIEQLAAPALVPLIEAGLGASDEAFAAVDAILAALPTSVDAIVYGCTHYPLIEAQFRRARPTVRFVDPAVAQALATRELLAAQTGSQAGSGRTTYLTNGDVALFEANVRRWTGEAAPHVAQLALAAPRR